MLQTHLSGATPIERVRRYIVTTYISRGPSPCCAVCGLAGKAQYQEVFGIAGAALNCCVDDGNCGAVASADLAALTVQERAEAEQLWSYFKERPREQVFAPSDQIMLAYCSNPNMLEMAWEYVEKKQRKQQDQVGQPVDVRSAEAIGPEFVAFMDKHAELIRKIRFCWGLDSSEDWFQNQRRSRPTQSAPC